jgi:hypothetical protein
VGRVITMLNLLLCHDLKARKLGDAKGGRHRDVLGVTTASHDNAADAGMVVTRVYRVPTAIEKDFGTGAEIHGIGINRNGDVAEIAGAKYRAGTFMHRQSAMARCAKSRHTPMPSCMESLALRWGAHQDN